MDRVTPFILTRRHLDTLLGHLPAAFDGDVESVHQARVATRRLREVLPFLSVSASRVRDNDKRVDIAQAVRAAGRHLGRVRELDVMGITLHHASARMPSTAGVITAAQVSIDERLRTARRAMVKKVERLDLEDLRKVLSHRYGARWSGATVRVRQPDWTDPMWARITRRSEQAAEAVRRAPGTYFRKRAHEARIAVKKLRYALEVAADTGSWHSGRILKDLRRIQGTLGDLHDAQILIDAFDDLFGKQAASHEAATLRALLQDDIARAHAEYTRRRDRIFALTEACARAASHARASRRQRRLLVAASLVAAPVFMAAQQARGDLGDHQGHGDHQGEGGTVAPAEDAAASGSAYLTAADTRS